METNLVTHLAAGESVKVVGSGTVSLVASKGVTVSKITAVKALPGAFGLGAMASTKGAISTFGPFVGLAALTLGMYWVTKEMMLKLDHQKPPYQL
ncbi:MAG: hypothetical protein HQL53_04575 [Magnetococcales bacterium]|nr:hypothetical protein [Magnetococcales bacterium]